jgi:hypothetical protein
MDTSLFLKPLGRLRNELLIFDIASALMTFHYGATMVSESKNTITLIAGVFLHFAAFIIIMAFGILYFKTLRFLPRTEQERQFEATAERVVEDHVEKLEGKP